MPDPSLPKPPPVARARAFARVGLLGNPSDGYGGRVLAFTIADFHARVTARHAVGIELGGGAGATPPARYAAVAELRAALAARALDGGAALLGAALERFDAEHAEVGGVALSFVSDVPRQVGLAGSSAIVVAALRALAELCGRPLEPGALAALALRAETDTLGIAAGPQDRLVQAHEGLLDMDFGRGAVTPLDPGLLPPLFIAWDGQPGEDSGAVHGAVRARFAAGEERIGAVMRALAGLAAEGAGCLARGDHERLRALVDQNFDLRASVFPIAARHRRLVDLGRSLGAAVKFAGSGGAVVGVPRAADDLAALEVAYVEAGWRWLRPTIKPCGEPVA